MHLKNLSIEQRQAGWPDHFQPHHLAGLQGSSSVGENARIDAGFHMTVVIITACKAGALEHTTTAARLETQQRRTYSPGIASPEWLERGLFSSTANRINNTQAAKFKDVTLYHITAPAFSAWLAAQGEPPSVHIAAWFKAVGVSPVVPQPQAEEPIPGIDSVRKRQDGRLQRLRIEFGGDRLFDRATGKWKNIGRGAFTELVAALKSEDARPNDEKTVRADLQEAVEREQEAKRTSPFAGLDTV